MVILPLLLLSITVTSMLPSTATLPDPSHAEHSPNPRFRSGPCLRPLIYTTGQTDFIPFTPTSTDITPHYTMVSQGCHVESSPIRNIYNPGFLHLNPSSSSSSASSPPTFYIIAHRVRDTVHNITAPSLSTLPLVLFALKNFTYNISRPPSYGVCSPCGRSP
jgi:hypothetical protein